MTEKPDDEMFTGAARDVLVDLLENGANTPSNVAENTDRHPKTVSERLADLESSGYVRNKGGVWELTMKGLTAAQTISQHRS